MHGFPDAENGAFGAESETREIYNLRSSLSTLSWSSLQALRLAAARARSTSLPHSNPATAAVIGPAHDSVLDYRGVQKLKLNTLVVVFLV